MMAREALSGHFRYQRGRGAGGGGDPPLEQPYFSVLRLCVCVCVCVHQWQFASHSTSLLNIHLSRKGSTQAKKKYECVPKSRHCLQAGGLIPESFLLIMQRTYFAQLSDAQTPGGFTCTMCLGLIQLVCSNEFREGVEVEMAGNFLNWSCRSILPWKCRCSNWYIILKIIYNTAHSSVCGSRNKIKQQ